jgi:formate hydrogenlyase subunit 3/multisubunit Na+/H+ antiporter MnhD subunit
MKLSPDLTRYFVWAGIVVVGALLAVIDRRQIRRPVFGLLLVAAVVGGFIVEKVSPFSFGVRNYYMEGVIISAGSALALIGYIFAVVWQFVRRRIGWHSPS